ncbi:hypothetical protein HK100_003446 [Physocladia obscura]|uniref:GH18 domain-containing protein n=1 Tax=Physocladia obscura TaxID=109957 RepID=A0AAD5T7P4_9FUNG|nr:hypothetical protein HK100_003446 [Physocladia obscura]
MSWQPPPQPNPFANAAAIPMPMPMQSGPTRRSNAGNPQQRSPNPNQTTQPTNQNYNNYNNNFPPQMGQSLSQGHIQTQIRRSMSNSGFVPPQQQNYPTYAQQPQPFQPQRSGSSTGNSGYGAGYGAAQLQNYAAQSNQQGFNSFTNNQGFVGNTHNIGSGGGGLQQQQQQAQPGIFYGGNAFGAAEFQEFQNSAAGKLGMQLGSEALKQGEKIVHQNINRFVNIPKLKFYFNVSNSYVINKLRVLVFSFRQKSWTRLVVRSEQNGQMEGYKPPREDLNAPDLYIPIMSFVTYVLLVGVTLNMRKKFEPEVLGLTSSTALVVVAFEVLLFKLCCYLLSVATEVPFLDLIAYCGYKFVPYVNCSYMPSTESYFPYTYDCVWDFGVSDYIVQLFYVEEHKAPRSSARRVNSHTDAIATATTYRDIKKFLGQLIMDKLEVDDTATAAAGDSAAVASTTSAVGYSKKKRTLIVGAAAVVVVALAAGLGGYFGTHKSTSAGSGNGSSSNSTGSSTSGSSSASGSGSLNTATATVSASPTPTGAKGEFVGYWGQNTANNGLDIVAGPGQRALSAALNQLSLDAYCDLGFYSTISLAFLDEFGGGDNHFTINFANFALYKWDGTQQTSGADALITIGQHIQHCQQEGVRILLSLGGDQVSNYSFAQGDGLKYATLFYNAFLGGSDTTVKPFGSNVVLDGLELDIEKNAADVTSGADPSAWTPEMVTFVTTIKSLSSKSILAAVPQCSLSFPGFIGKDKNIGDLLAQTPSSFDYISIQYYNNIECTYPFGFNYDTWKTLFPGTIYLGIPGNPISAISGGFLDPPALQAVYNFVKGDSQFGGLSVYDVSSSNAPGLDWSATDYTNPPVSNYSAIVHSLLQGNTVATPLASPGPALLESDFDYRCGGTWTYANATCSLPTCNPYASVTGCGSNQQCFRFISKC